jgi:RimJ/RimL family protein N-acetyltransferase
MSRTFNFPDTVPELAGDGVRLRELTEDDVPGWFARASDPESSALSGDPIPESIEAGVRWLQGHRERFRQQTGIRWAIVPEGSTESVGTIGLAITSKAERIAELGVVIARAYWGQGIATSAARLVTGYAFETLGLVEVQSEFDKRNVASRRVFEKLGFRYLRDVPADLQSATSLPDGFLYVLQNGLRRGS